MTVYSFITIDDPFATAGTFAEGINGKGQIVGTYRHASDTHGFVDTGIGGATLDDPLATNGTSAYGINDSGQIVGAYYGGPGTGEHGFLWNGGTYTTLDYLSFPKIPSVRIRAVRQNQRIMRCDACDHPPACKVHSRSVQVTTPA